MVGERSSKVLEEKLKRSVLFPTPESPISKTKIWVDCIGLMYIKPKFDVS
jgi:hypothetical protein